MKTKKTTPWFTLGLVLCCLGLVAAAAYLYKTRVYDVDRANVSASSADAVPPVSSADSIPDIGKPEDDRTNAAPPAVTPAPIPVKPEPDMTPEEPVPPDSDGTTAVAQEEVPPPLLGKAGKVVYTKYESSVGGKPFMPRGIYGVGIGDMRRAASYGFNIVQSYGLNDGPDDASKKYLDAARHSGVKVLLTLGMCHTAPEVIRRRVALFKHHPALYGWYLADEPSVKSIKVEEANALYDWIKKTDPNHPVFSSNWELGNFNKACDVDMPQLYHGPPSNMRRCPLAGQTAYAAKNGVQWIAIANTYDSNWGAHKSEVSLNPDSIRSAAKKGKLTEAEAKERITAIRKNPTHPPYPPSGAFPGTPIQIRGQAFDLLAHGSNGMFYWLLSGETDIHPTYGWYTFFVYPQLRKALRETFAEMDTLWPRLANPSVGATTWRDSTNETVTNSKGRKEHLFLPKKQPASPNADEHRTSDGNVFYWSRRQGKTVTIIAVNESETDNLEVYTRVPELRTASEAVATVSGPEKRNLKMPFGKLKDTFRANEAHVYLIDLK